MALYLKFKSLLLQFTFMICHVNLFCDSVHALIWLALVCRPAHMGVLPGIASGLARTCLRATCVFEFETQAGLPYAMLSVWTESSTQTVAHGPGRQVRKACMRYVMAEAWG